MNACDHYTIYHYRVDSVDYFLGSDAGDVIFGSQSEPLFTHTRTTAIILPDSD